MGNKSIKSNIYVIQANDLITCGYFFIGFTDFMLKVKNLLEHTNYFLLMRIKTMVKNTEIFSITRN